MKTPIGNHKVYVIAVYENNFTNVFDLNHDGIETYDDLATLLMLEELSGKFGHGYERLVVTSPGANLEGANLNFASLQGANLNFASLQGANLEGANLRGAYYPTGTVPEGWRRTETGYLAKA